MDLIVEDAQELTAADGMIKIELTLDSQLTGLAGNRFGREVYRKQIADKMTDDDVLAVLPENITDVASSFYEGLFADLSERYW